MLGGVALGAGRPARGSGATGCGCKFKLGLLQSIRGIVRFHLVRLEPTFELYASPVNFDPESPLFPISHPAGLRRRARRGHRHVLHHGDGRGPHRPDQRADRRGGVPRPVRPRLARARGHDAATSWSGSTRASSTACSTRPTASSTCSGGSASPITRPTAARPPTRVRRASSRSTTAAATRSSARPCRSPTTRRCVIVLSDHGFGSFRRGVPPQHAGSTTTGCWPCSAGARPGRGRRRPAPRTWTGDDQGLCAGPGRDLPQPARARGQRGRSGPARPTRLKSDIARATERPRVDPGTAGGRDPPVRAPRGRSTPGPSSARRPT